ncbi:MAG: hypothetical protein LBL33_10685 [Tannerella sp.]|jgi:hypothetical protein|nr:hypothetical protein [Tannerella sp.]
MKKILIILCLLSGSLPIMHAQQNDFTCIGIVRDKNTNAPLKDVRIYYLDTVPVYNDASGKFRLQVKIGDKLHFRRSGYGWHTETVEGKELQTVYLAPNTLFTKNEFSRAGAYHPDSTEIIYDGIPVPFEEWDDAGNTPKPEVISLMTIRAKNGQKNKAIFESIFQWNQKE